MTERAIMQKMLGDTEVPIGVTTCTRGSSRHVPTLKFVKITTTNNLAKNDD